MIGAGYLEAEEVLWAMRCDASNIIVFGLGGGEVRPASTKWLPPRKSRQAQSDRKKARPAVSERYIKRRWFATLHKPEEGKGGLMGLDAASGAGLVKCSAFTQDVLRHGRNVNIYLHY